MLYLVFGSLLLLGSLVFTCFFNYTQGGIKIKAKVIDSTCQVERREEEITKIDINHLLLLTSKEGEREYTASYLPVREAAGSEITIRINRKTGEPRILHWGEAVPAIIGMIISGLVCFLFFYFQNIYLNSSFEINYRDLLLALFVSVAIFSFHEIFLGLNPNIVKVKGSFEGWMYLKEQKTSCEIYSLWYGEYQQYAKCNSSSIFSKMKQKENILYYHVKKGTVRKKADIIGNVCFGVGLIVIGLIIFFFL